MSYFVSALLNARCWSFSKTFHLSFTSYHACGCVSGVQIFKFRVRHITQVLDPLRNGSVLMTCTALAHAARACSCMVCFSAGHSARASQVNMRYEALIRGPFTSIDNTADPSPWSIVTQSGRHCPELTGVWLAVCLVSNGPYTGIFDLKYR